MFVRLTTGNRAGEIQEMKFETARMLIDSGSAIEETFEGRKRAEDLDSLDARGREPGLATKPAAANRPKGKKR